MKKSSKSPLMRKKQEEMDAVIGMIYELLKRQGEKSSKPSLLLLCSDHGMNEVNIFFSF